MGPLSGRPSNDSRLRDHAVNSACHAAREVRRRVDTLGALCLMRSDVTLALNSRRKAMNGCPFVPIAICHGGE